MSDRTIAETGKNSSSDRRPPLDDPELLEELAALDDPEDRADYLEALDALADLNEEELCSWEDVKAELGH
ncbi:MAG: hypothetical protein WBG50_20700 [Desulfomonilaceae bacterium]